MKSKVFGIGLSRTGTNSLNTALNILGINTIHYPDDQDTWEYLSSGRFDLPILEEYDGITDIQAAAFFPFFDKQYPNSKFICTIRDKKKWLVSVRRKMEGKNNRSRGPFFANFEWLRTAMYGIVGWNEDVFSHKYTLHMLNVMLHFQDRYDDLLVMNICNGEGWEVLCPFLGKEIPDTQFPWEQRMP